MNMSKLPGISFAAPSYYSDGVQPSAAINNDGYFVEVHKSQSGSDLWYLYGKLTTDKAVTSLGTSQKLCNPGSTSADTGYQPNCAMNNNRLVVEVHQAKNETGDIWTHVGTGDTKGSTLSWGKSQKTGFSGVSPSVALTDWNKVILVFDDGNGQLKYVVGDISFDDQEISWGKAADVGNGWAGNNPIISISKDNMVALAYLYKNGDGNTMVCCSVSFFDADGGKINWADNNQIMIDTSGDDTAASPSVAITGGDESAKLLLVYENGPTGSHNIFQHTYTSKLAFLYWDVWEVSQKIKLSGHPLQYTGAGKKPIVAASTDGTKMLMVAESPDVSLEINPQKLNFGIGFPTALPGKEVQQGDKVITNKYKYLPQSWMTGFASKSLQQLIFPGAHDAGMYKVQHDCQNMIDSIGPAQTQTQQYDFKGMLERGIRYFDVRPVWWQSTLYTGHFSDIIGIATAGCCGAKMDDILSDVADFIETYKDAQEVIILKFSHYYNRDTDSWDDSASIIESVKSSLDKYVKDYLFINTTDDRLAELALDTIAPSRSKNPSGTTSQNPLSKIIAVFDEMTATSDDNDKGFYSYQDLSTGKAANLVVFDEFSNTNKIDNMISDQVAKFENTDNHKCDLFLLSWTLTPDWGDEAASITSVATLAKEADATLMPELLYLWQTGKISEGMLPNILYVDYADTFATDVAVTLNTYLDEGDQ